MPEIVEQHPAQQERATSNPMVVERYRPGYWEAIKNEVMAIEASAFGEKGYNERDIEVLKSIFENPTNLNLLLVDSGSRGIVGYTLVEFKPDGETAYVRRSAVIPAQQGKGYIGKLMDVVESELTTRGIRYLTREAEVRNGYANTVQRQYGDAIIEAYDTDHGFGVRRYFKIDLQKRRQ